MTKLGKLLHIIFAIRVYQNGSGEGFVWNWWHPVSWILAPLCLILSCLTVGVPEAWKYKDGIGIGMTEYFIRHPDQLQWISRKEHFNILNIIP